jgi:hypothetical protein
MSLGAHALISMLVSLLFDHTVSSSTLPAAVSRATGIEVWRGNMSYPCVNDCPKGVQWLAHNVPINKFC